jgi:hypothetical protein
MNQFSKIADGLSSWLNFELRTGRKELFSESYLAQPLAQLLRYRFPGKVIAEVQHPILGSLMQGPGKRPCVDFAVNYLDGIYDIMVETKWISKSPTLLVDIIRDVIHLDLVTPTYAKEAILVVAGLKKDFEDLFEDSQFKPHPDNRNSKHILPLGNHTKASVRLLPIPQWRKKLFERVLIAFKGIEISKSIKMVRSGSYPQYANSTQYEVYIWRVKKFDETEKFKPEEFYDIV